eukprot:TRINITY_DN32772_c0_g2_i2.p1 TRINITY_DN32772_c0_g2~~TRINITY_DN32772_c0_g2_i2.p1  ORF type:complete len:442 (-),score=24.99 TRINITY_DN32772_c0_g2_i2:654-1943(-)
MAAAPDCSTYDAAAKKRIRVTGTFCALGVCTLGFVYGSSPLVLPVAEALRTQDAESAAGLFEGGYFLYGMSLLFVLFNLFAFIVSWWLHSRPEDATRAVHAAFVMWPLGCAFLACSVQFKVPLLLFLGFAVLAPPLAVIDLYICHIELPRTWPEDEVHKGMSALGFSIGFGAIFWSLMTGELADAFGAAPALWAVTIGQTVILLLIHFLLEPWKIFAERASADAEASVSDAMHKDSKQAQVQPQQTCTEDASISGAIRDWRVWTYCYIICAMVFCGRAIKMLISVIFEQALDMSYIDAVHVSAAYLLLYCVGRGLTPLLAIGDRIYLLYGCILAMESVAYASTPWSLSLSSYREPVYVCLRLLSGGGFAVMLGNLTVLSVRTFGLARNHAVLAVLMTVEWTSGVGPTIAWALHVVELRSGKPAMQSYIQ